MEHKKWVILCIIGGTLMFLSSLVGRVGVIGTLITSLSTSGLVPLEIQQVLEIILTVFSYIAAAGGLSVITGAFIAGFNSDRLGRFIVGLGIGTTINDIPSILFTAFNSAYGFVGVVISILGRMRLKD